jgi:hypothetical protein
MPSKRISSLQCGQRSRGSAVGFGAAFDAAAREKFERPAGGHGKVARGHYNKHSLGRLPMAMGRQKPKCASLDIGHGMISQHAENARI